MPAETPKASAVILVAGAIAGILDITFAFVFYGFQRGISPVRILQSISSGLLGKEAYQGGLATTLLGVALHFFIATTAAAVYYAASRKLPLLVRHAVVCGLLYGAGVYAVMNLVVLPLSAYPNFKMSFEPSRLLPGLLAIMFCVGLSIALIVRRYSKA
jgi:hypothetical protein